MRRANTSITNAMYTKPRQVATYVRSAPQSWSGWAAVNWRVTRSGGRVIAASGMVVTVTGRPRTTPTSPRRRISRASVQRAILGPDALNVRAELLITMGPRRTPMGFALAGLELVVPRRGDRQDRADRLDP